MLHINVIYWEQLTLGNVARLVYHDPEAPALQHLLL